MLHLLRKKARTLENLDRYLLFGLIAACPNFAGTATGFEPV